MVAEYFPNHTILGNLKPAIIYTKNPEEILRPTKKNIQQGKEIPGGYIFSPGCEIPPMAPRENVRVMTEAVNDFGWYE